MSAIAGIYHSSKEPVNREHIQGIMENLKQFPADDIQVWHKENIFLGCYAQWITPESIEEQLPYYDHERQLAITADAIIDNREELFERLQVDKPNRKVITDSQLILHTYEKWGEACPKYLIGDFTFMIWDERKQRLFGARDFSGSRTLYYYYDSLRFAFCTTIQPLLSLPYVKKQLNEQWMAEFLATPGMNEGVDTSITVHKMIQQLPPSHSITIANGQKKICKYCTVIPSNKLRLNSNEEYIEAFSEVFQTAVNSRLRTYKNIGAHLSGGLDSGSVVGFAARELRKQNKQLHTFSYVPSADFIDWTPKNAAADERPFIQSTVQYVGNIQDHYHSFDEINPLSEINEWLGIMEMPYKFFANANWLKGIFERANDQGVGVLLNGGRGNLSISWGPVLEYYALLLKKVRWLYLLRELNQYSKNMGGSRMRLLPTIGKIAFPTLTKYQSLNDSSKQPLIINPQLAKRTKVFDKLKGHGIDVRGSAPLENVYMARKKHFEETFPWNATGTLGTKLSLRYSTWKRDPTNDLRVIRFCLSIPEDQYVQNGFGRALIRRATKNILPDKVRLNQKVRGIQGADCIHRMTPYWEVFIHELENIAHHPVMMELINMEVFQTALEKMKQGPRAEYSFDSDYQVLMHSLNVYRYIKHFT
ncbi:lasso peptide isopeptide bond-forming cyclase [Domibacillus sp.]|uniref:lasso peptide isopeptide bond-forming cyclase n=1 Tax=Domibacillus sp. TaxID=1969783 RepID=UPI002811B5AA|nr:lasso peptide isopeptide bond-forming cyclase [Domibacillus sp.]